MCMPKTTWTFTIIRRQWAGELRKQLQELKKRGSVTTGRGSSLFTFYIQDQENIPKDCKETREKTSFYLKENHGILAYKRNVHKHSNAGLWISFSTHFLPTSDCEIWRRFTLGIGLAFRSVCWNRTAVTQAKKFEACTARTEIEDLGVIA